MADVIDGLKSAGVDPAWIFVVVLIMAIGAVSPTMAKVKGPLGSVARWFMTRTERAVRREESQRAINRAHIGADLEDMQRQIDYLKGRVEASELRDKYLEYDAEWHANTRLVLAEKGCELPPPAHLTFSEWRTLRNYQGDQTR